MSPADDWTGLPFDELDPPDEVRVLGASALAAKLPLSVSELSAQLKQTIEGRFSRVLVEGEVSNCRAWSSGHIYFTLKDDYAQIRAVMFRSQARQLKFSVEDGLRVVVRGRLSLYEVKGDYQLIVDAMEPHGLGALQAAFEQLKRTLQAEGLFDAARKRPLPVLPRRIGIVTSARRRRPARHPAGHRPAPFHRANRGAPRARAGRRGAAQISCARCAPSSRCPKWTSSSSAAAADRPKTCGRSTTSGSRAPSPPVPCR